mgnify:CR=1 FL=1
MPPTKPAYSEEFREGAVDLLISSGLPLSTVARELGIDEHTIHKGHRMATTFCNLSARKVFDIVEGRSAQELESFLKRLKGRHRVKVNCID